MSRLHRRPSRPYRPALRLRSAPCRENGRRVAPHRFRKADQLVHRLALHPQRREQTRNQRVTCRPARISSIAASASTRVKSSSATIFSSASRIMKSRQGDARGTYRCIFRRLVSFREPRRSLLVLDVPSKLVAFASINSSTIQGELPKADGAGMKIHEYQAKAILGEIRRAGSARRNGFQKRRSARRGRSGWARPSWW